MNISLRYLASNRRRLVMGLAATTLLLAASLVSLQAARAATTINVTTTVDSNNATNYECPSVTKPCTLRLAIAAANNDTGDTVSLPAGTYTLTMHSELQVRAAMNIVGADPRTTIIDGDAANQADNRMIHVLSNPIDVSIRNLTLQHGFSSSGSPALLNQSTGTVTLDNDSIVDNSAQAGGNVFGGAVFNGTEGATNMVVTRSLFARNMAEHGTDTSQPSEGGGIYNQPGGTLSVTNSTFNANQADEGGGIANGGVVTLLNDTIAGNTAAVVNTAKGGGGLFDVTPTRYNLSNTIVAGNTNGDCAGTLFVSGGHNLDSDNSCSLTATGDKPSTDPKLAALALNAPGQTGTMAIDATSPAYNAAGTAGCPATDQRGVTRPQGPACDIGAYELIVTPPSPSPSPTAVALPKAGANAGATPGGWTWLPLALLAIVLSPLAVATARRGLSGHRRG